MLPNVSFVGLFSSSIFLTEAAEEEELQARGFLAVLHQDPVSPWFVLSLFFLWKSVSSKSSFFLMCPCTQVPAGPAEALAWVGLQQCFRPANAKMKTSYQATSFSHGHQYSHRSCMAEPPDGENDFL